MAKIVVETIHVVKRRYLIETDKLEWAADDVVCEDLEPYEYTKLNEDIVSVREVECWKDAGRLIGFDNDKSTKVSTYYVYDADTNTLERRCSSLLMMD